MPSIGKGASRKRAAPLAGEEAPAPGSGPPNAGADHAGRSVVGVPMQANERERQIAIIAYYKAQQRGFQGGNQLNDWLAAEREFDGAYLARTIGQQDDEP